MSAAGTGSPSHQDPIPQSNSLPVLPAPPQPPPSNPRRLPPPCWSHDETVALIDAYRDKWYSLRRGNLKANHWQEVADAVGQRCPAACPAKTAVQCRHKMEKLRKRYRTEIQRARSMPVSRFTSSWVHFKRMDAMEKGPEAVKPDYNTESEGDDNEDENDDEEENQGFYVENYRNGSTTTPTPANNMRSIHKLYRNGIPNTGSSSNLGVPSVGGAAFRIKIPTGVSIAQPGPNFYPKIEQTSNNLSWSKLNYGSGSGLGGGGGGSGGGVGVGGGSSRVAKGSEEIGKKREREPIEEMVNAIKLLGDGFVRMEQMKMEMAREIETMRIDMEMKRTGMILESQQRIIEAFAKAFSEKKGKKKPKNMGSPDS
ncbi:hypothetical protein K2173_024948 [Erythroxylum novogranatense]|uniref:Myb-like domain-containing protein n=1 Tax=Erythroxylum novogranatense TaxID=1862640 RepID=A0AAV8UGX2_9ROSI|nr:hypothetical protein K2173_024948 [Erythroxylum novogranatense]